MTTKKSFILAAALGLSSLCFAGPKSYTIVLGHAATAGNVQLAAGQYKLNIDGRIAIFTNTDTTKSVMVLVRTGVGDRTFERTAVEVKDENGASAITAIELQDSSSTLEF